MTRMHVVTQGISLFSVIGKLYDTVLIINPMNSLFDGVIAPMVLYRAEAWGLRTA